MKNTFLFRVFISIIAPLMALVVAPLSFYFGNKTQIEDPLTEAALPIIMHFFALSLILFSILHYLKKKQTAYRIFSALLIGFAASIWAQSQLMVWDFGPLDGRGTDWEKWTDHMWLEGGVWLAIIFLSIHIFLRRSEKLQKSILQLVYLLASTSILSGYISSPATETTVQTDSNPDSFFTFHPTNNVIIILLDTFQSDYFSKISETHPEETVFLDGFIYYDNVMSGYPTTRPNIPFIFTGIQYKNQQPFNTFREEVYSKSDLRRQYTDNGYDLAEAGVERPMRSLNSVLAHFNYHIIPPWTKYFDFGLFRLSPSIFKKHIYNEGDWLISAAHRASYPPSIHATDIRFLELFEKEAHIEPDSKSTFKFMHFTIPHWPLRVDENLKYNTSLKGAEGYSRQARGALHLTKRIIKRIQELGVYESSEIVILADHGTIKIPPLNRDTKDIVIFEVPEKAQASALPLLLHKPPFSKGMMTTSGDPITIGDLGCLLVTRSEDRDCNNFNIAKSKKIRKRFFYYYDWKHAYWKKDFMPDMKEYYIDGNVRNPIDWQQSGYLYKPGQILLDSARIYKIGDMIDFGEQGTSRHYVRGGWSHQEPNGRWTERHSATLSFSLDSEIKEDLILKVLGSGFHIKGKIEYQKVDVWVNNKKLTRWLMSGEKWHSIIIPKENLQERKIEVAFNIITPIAPSDIGLSADDRKLGMLVRRLTIDMNSKAQAKNDNNNIKSDISNKYTIGNKVDFSKEGNSWKYTRGGWSSQENHFRWSEGDKAILHFKTNQNEIEGDLQLRLKGKAFLATEKIKHQLIRVLMGGKILGEWIVTDEGWYTASIPLAQITNGEIELTLEIDNPSAPCDFGLSNDCRKLGLQAKEVQIVTRGNIP